jgi:putative transposase
MPRTARAIVGGHYYHLINRSNNGTRLFASPGCYFDFLALLSEAQERLPLPLLAACLMPNHLHLVVRPEQDIDLARWTHWTFTTHVRRHHARLGTRGRVWQGRFKAFIIQQDEHLLTVLRYVERNALRAGLVDRAEDWRWGSLQWRLQPQAPLALTPPPISLPHNWVDYVNQPQTSTELAALRTCVNRQRPFGEHSWVEKTAHSLGLTQSISDIAMSSKR